MSKSLEELVELFHERKYLCDMGGGKLSQMFGVTRDEISIIKSLARGKTARADIKTTPKMIARNIKLPKPFIGGDEDNVLIISDLHLPFDKDGYLEFCRDVQEFFNCGTVVQIGDLVDNHYCSYHESIPEGYGAQQELNFAKIRIKEWERVFPVVTVTNGTHDYRPLRKMRTGLTPNEWMRSFADVYDTPGWSYVDEFIHNGVKYVHGTTDAWTNLLNSGCSVVQGHLHSRASVQWHNLGSKPIFAMQVGTGINDKAYAFEYARGTVAKSHISCGVIFGGNPIVINKDVWESNK